MKEIAKYYKDEVERLTSSKNLLKAILNHSNQSLKCCELIKKNTNAEDANVIRLEKSILNLIYNIKQQESNDI
jgi:hypothetical protein